MTSDLYSTPAVNATRLHRTHRNFTPLTHAACRRRALVKDRKAAVREKQRAVSRAQRAVERAQGEKEKLRSKVATARIAVKTAKEKLKTVKREHKATQVRVLDERNVVVRNTWRLFHSAAVARIVPLCSHPIPSVNPARGDSRAPTLASCARRRHRWTRPRCKSAPSTHSSRRR